MSYETGTASDHFDLLDKVRTFVSATISPTGQRWTVNRWAGYRTVLASSFLAPYEPFKAFNGDAGIWATAVNQATPSFLGLRFVAGLAPDLISLDATGTDTTQSPQDFSLQYSDDGTSWTTHQSWTAQTNWSATPYREFTVTGAPTKAYWRIYVTANNGNTVHTSIGELRICKTFGFGVQLNHAVNAHLLLQAPGVSETDELFCGLQIYERSTSDVYNWRAAGFTGYVSSNTFATQPGTSGPNGLPLWNQPMTYWLVANGNRLILVVKVESTYQTLYLGKALPYATPNQWPYPFVLGGMLTTDSETRYSDTGLSFAFKGSRANLKLRGVQGSWSQPQAWPWVITDAISGAGTLAFADVVRDTGGQYALTPIVLTDTTNVYGELDGVYQVSGFGNSAEDIVTAGGVDHLVVQDVYRNGVRDFIAVKLA